MPIIQHLGTAFASGSDGEFPVGNITTSSLLSWFDPAKFSNYNQGTMADPHTASSDTTQWRINRPGQAVSGLEGHAVEPSGGGSLIGANTNGDVPAFNVSNYTIEVWLYVGQTNNGSWGHLGGKAAFWGNNEGGIYINSDGVTMGHHTSSSGNPGINIPAIGWHQFCFVRNQGDSNCRKLYVDSNLVISDNTGDNDAGHQMSNNYCLSVNCHSNNANTAETGGYHPVNWKMGHGRFYTKGLSSTEVSTNWNAQRSTYGV